MPQTDIVILKALLESKSRFVSGNHLANELGISRVGVWARLEKMREMEFDFEAIRHRGYRLLREPPVLNERLVRAYLELFGSPAPIIFHESVDSTNDVAERELANGREAPFVVLAGQQLKGRGRLGRAWHSPAEGNIYASYAFRPRIPISRMQTITLWFGLNVCHLLNEGFDIPVRIKWPNDLMLHGKKVCGMLTEARIDTDLTRDLVFGLGLNVNGDVDRWPPEVARIATTLSSDRTDRLLVNKVAARITQTLLSAYSQFLADDHRNTLENLWQKYDCLYGNPINSTVNGNAVAGIADGIDTNGCLRLRLEDGKAILLHAGEVTLNGKTNCDKGNPAAA